MVTVMVMVMRRGLRRRRWRVRGRLMIGVGWKKK